MATAELGNETKKNLSEEVVEGAMTGIRERGKPQRGKTTLRRGQQTW